MGKLLGQSNRGNVSRSSPPRSNTPSEPSTSRPAQSRDTPTGVVISYLSAACAVYACTICCGKVQRQTRCHICSWPNCTQFVQQNADMTKALLTLPVSLSLHHRNMSQSFACSNCCTAFCLKSYLASPCTVLLSAFANITSHLSTLTDLRHMYDCIVVLANVSCHFGQH